MVQGGSTMGEEPTWWELLFAFALMAAIPTLIGGALVLSLVGLVVWATAPLRGRRRARAPESGRPLGGERYRAGSHGTAAPGGPPGQAFGERQERDG
ncbi:hypothetical protein ACFVYR_29470 [Streptomyces sp. NPDC058284]|uniref:hypothetical protein n=1 Tax=unclassified Streptomyces TaxID=2593676 RepID=UPI003661917B